MRRHEKNTPNTLEYALCVLTDLTAVASEEFLKNEHFRGELAAAYTKLANVYKREGDPDRSQEMFDLAQIYLNMTSSNKGYAMAHTNPLYDQNSLLKYAENYKSQ